MLVNEFGEFIAQTRYKNLPGEVIEVVKLRVLDVLGSALAGYRMGCHKHLLPILEGAGEATSWGLGRKFSLRDASLFNSFLSHALYLEDGSRFTGGHPSSVVIPSTIALAETQQATGKDLITAVAVGYEIFLRLGRAIYPSTVQRGFQSTAVLGAAASASACANLLQFSAEMAKNSLAIACSLGVGLKEALKSSGSQPIQVARSCESGIVAALLAGEGAVGADSIIENGLFKAFGQDVMTDQILTGLGIKFHIFETYIKVHGGCRGNHAPVDVVQDVMAKNAIVLEGIGRIVVRVDSVTFAAEIHTPTNGNEAQFSIAFAVAVALIYGDASIFQYTDAKVADTLVHETMLKIHVEVDKELDKGYPHNRASSVEIQLIDGRRFNGYVANAKGEPEYPFTEEEIVRKFLTLTKDVLKGGGERVCDLVMRLEEINDLKVLTSTLKGCREEFQL